MLRPMKRIASGWRAARRDFAYGDAFPHEADMDQLNGVDFAKGAMSARWSAHAALRHRAQPGGARLIDGVPLSLYAGRRRRETMGLGSAAGGAASPAVARSRRRRCGRGASAGRRGARLRPIDPHGRFSPAGV
jgi:hypothetical protein